MDSVLIIVENLPVPLDYRVWLIAQTLRAEGYTVTIISPANKKYPQGEFDIENIKIYRHNLPQAQKLYQYFGEYIIAICKEFYLSIKIYKKYKFKIIHACNPPDILWIIALFWKLFGVKFIYDHHDLSPEILLAKNNTDKPHNLPLFKKIIHKLLILNERISHKLADCILTTNESFRKIALNRNKCSGKKVFTVRTGPKLIELNSIPKNVEKKNIIAYVGVMAAQDGVDILLRATHYAIKKLNKKFTLLLMGDGPLFDDLTSLANKLEIHNYVNFTGFIPRKIMLQKLIHCLFGVTPDLPGQMNDFSTMLKVQDYMLAGLAQIMFDLPENRATAENAALYVKNNDYVKLAEAIALLIDDSNLRKNLEKNARSRIKKLVWENSGAKQLIRAYNSLQSTKIVD